MEKTFQLDQRELQQSQQMEQERMQALAAVGALMLDLETARKNLDAVAGRQQSFLRDALGARGVSRFDGARAMNGTIYVAVPDEQPAAAVQPFVEPRVNGKVVEAGK